eukprot:4022609-Amphidinium_carterae.1
MSRTSKAGKTRMSVTCDEEQLQRGVPEDALTGHAWHTYTLTSQDYDANKSHIQKCFLPCMANQNHASVGCQLVSACCSHS